MKSQIEENGIVILTKETAEQLQHSNLWNDDLRPATKEEHTWTGRSFAALWIGMCLIIPSYTMASGMISLGMNWWQALLTIFLGNCVVLVPILLNAHAGAKFGIPYPVFARLWFGSKGAHIPTLARAIVAAGWFGINTWIGTTSIDALMSRMVSGWSGLPFHTGIVFLLFWALNVGIGIKGPEAIKWLATISTPVVGVSSIILFIWAATHVNGWGPILTAPSKFQTTGEFLAVFFPALTGVIAFWATLALNIPDFARHAVNQKSMMISQSFALPLTMTIFSFIGIFVTSATVVIFGQALWQPVDLLSKFPTLVVFIGAIVVAISSITVNVGANLVAPARAVENLWPRRLTFASGAIVTGLFAIAMQPWYLMSNFQNLIYGFLGTYGALLGPIDGIAIADYWIVRRRRFDLKELYETNGRYNYSSGINTSGVFALVIGIAVPVVGLLVPGLRFLWDNAWTVGILVATVAYSWLMRNDRSLLSRKAYEDITVFVSRHEKGGAVTATVAEQSNQI